MLAAHPARTKESRRRVQGKKYSIEKQGMVPLMASDGYSGGQEQLPDSPIMQGEKAREGKGGGRVGGGGGGKKIDKTGGVVRRGPWEEKTRRERK